MTDQREAQLRALIHKLHDANQQLREIVSAASRLRAGAVEALEVQQLDALSKIAASSGNTLGAISSELLRLLPHRMPEPPNPISKV